MSTPLPTVYIPTLNGGERLAGCLESLRSQTMDASVVVADNGSGDGCRQLLESRFPHVHRIGFGENLGFGPALNRAIASHGDGAIILLNDDARPKPEFVEQLVAESVGVEMVAGVMLDDDSGKTIDSAGVIVDRTLMGFDYLHGLGVEVLDGAEPPMGPTGGGALYDRDAFNEAGGFDERIFLYLEDVDLALRIRGMGGRCRLARGARAAHAYSETLGSRSSRKYAMTGWSRGYLLRKYGVMNRLRTTLGALVQEAVVCSAQILRDHTTAGLRGRLRGWKDYGRKESVDIPAGVVTPLSTFDSLRLRSRRGQS